MADQRPALGSIPWTGGLQERQHVMYTPDNNMSVADNVELGFDGSKKKRRAGKDVMGIVYIAVSATTAFGA